MKILLLFFLADITLAWDLHTDQAVQGYKVYAGTTSRTYTQNAVITGRTVTTYTWKGLTAGTWFFAVTAFAGVTNESGFSNEVSTIVAPIPPANFRITNVTASARKEDAVIKWKTDLDATCIVRFGTDPELAWYVAKEGEHESHEIRLRNLARKTDYYFRPFSARDGVTVAGDTQTFRTK